MAGSLPDAVGDCRDVTSRVDDLNIMVDGYKEVLEEIDIHDKSDYKTYIEQDLVLKPLNLLEQLPAMEREED